MKSRTSSSYVHAFRSAFTFFASFSHPVTFLVLDNETSSELTTLFRSQKPSVRFQHVPPNNHRSNKAERAIQTTKNHFIAVLSSTHITFPPDRWPKLLPLAELTLNHLRKWHPNPSLSAWHGLRGSPHDFAAQPIHPPDQLVVIHDAPLKRASWARHGVRGFYLGPALSHYRSHICFVPKTGTTCISDSLAHFPDPLFPFEDIVPDAEPLPDPTSSRPHPAFDGLDLVDKSFVDPDLGVCTVISGAPCLSPSRRQPTSCRCTGGAHSSTQLSPCRHILRPTLALTHSYLTNCASFRRFRASRFLCRFIAYFSFSCRFAPSLRLVYLARQSQLQVFLCPTLPILSVPQLSPLSLPSLHFLSVLGICGCPFRVHHSAASLRLHSRPQLGRGR
jgi:hypothetical protein